VFSFVGGSMLWIHTPRPSSLKLGYKTGMEKGLAMGITYGILFCH
jgi:hypothetical protein